MTTASVDFWPTDIIEARTDSPADLLRTQADSLAGKTNGRLRGRVDTMEFANYAGTSANLAVISGGEPTTIRLQLPAFAHSLRILVPKLDDYSYELLTIRHGVTLYPVAAHMSGEDSPPTLLQDESALQEWLKSSLGSPTARQIISTLLAVAK